MPRPSPAARELVDRYSLALDVPPPRGAVGERLGRGTGGALEFEERRLYEPGDDVRRIDWAAYARTDQVYLRLYREEIAPRLELLLDDSRSVGHDPQKAQSMVDLALALAGCAVAADYRVKLVVLGERPRPLSIDELEGTGLAFEDSTPLAVGLRAARGLLGPGSVRLVLSDFLAPARAEELVRGLASGAGRLALIQLQGGTDIEPEVGSTARLVDAETGDEIDLVLDARTVATYQDRRRRLEEGLERECRRAGGVWASLDSRERLDDLARGPLSRAGVLIPG